jgi:hypothetical protein
VPDFSRYSIPKPENIPPPKKTVQITIKYTNLLHFKALQNVINVTDVTTLKNIFAEFFGEKIGVFTLPKYILLVYAIFGSKHCF